MDAHDYFCSTLSREAQEPLYGSAPEKHLWFLLEYTHPWGAKVLPESNLSNPIKTHLSKTLNKTPGSNLLFIRQPGQRQTGIRFYVAVASEAAPRLYTFTLSDYDDLLSLDLEAVIRGDAAFASHLTEEPLFLVCTNAKRDKCCAKYGIGIYNTMVKHDSTHAWQCSHMGGHRFAPTSLFFPHGICYGRFEPEHVVAMIETYRRRHLVLEHLRGRVCYEAPAQAADALLRMQLDLTAIDALTLIESASVSANQWAVQFRARGENHNVRLEKTTTDVEIYTSCFNDKTVLVEQYRLI